MRAYLAVTGVIFTLVVVAHLARTPEILSGFGEDPFAVVAYNVLTLMVAVLAVWALRLYRRLPA